MIPESAAAEGVSGTCFDLAGIGQLRWRGVRAIGNDRVLLVGRADDRGILQSKDRELRGAVVSTVSERVMVKSERP